MNMHELSIVKSIVDIASEEVRKHHAAAVEKINLEIGSLAGIELDALNFAWELAVKNTVLEDAEKEIHSVQAISKCKSCNQIFPCQTLYDPCPHCGNFFNDLTCGRELKIKSLTVS